MVPDTSKMTASSFFSSLPFLFLFLFLPYRESFAITHDMNGCTKVVHDFNPLLHKPKYRVGVYASEGDEVAHAMYDAVFQDYLTETAGKRFDPPLDFEVVPVSLTELLELAENEQVDFLFTSSAVFLVLQLRPRRRHWLLLLIAVSLEVTSTI